MFVMIGYIYFVFIISNLYLLVCTYLSTKSLIQASDTRTSYNEITENQHYFSSCLIHPHLCSRFKLLSSSYLLVFPYLCVFFNYSQKLSGQRQSNLIRRSVHTKCSMIEQEKDDLLMKLTP